MFAGLDGVDWYSLRTVDVHDLILGCPLVAGFLEVEGLVHAGDPHVLESGHAFGVDAHQHFDAVSRPGGNLGWGDPELSRQVTP
jgi:hypothetical protein